MSESECTSRSVENHRRALAAQHYAELDLFGAVVGHTPHLYLFSVLFKKNGVLFKFSFSVFFLSTV